VHRRPQWGTQMGFDILPRPPGSPAKDAENHPDTFSCFLRRQSGRLVKRSRALRGRNVYAPARPGIAKPTVRPRHLPRCPTAAGLFHHPLEHPSHASENPGVWGRYVFSVLRGEVSRSGVRRAGDSPACTISARKE